MSKDITPEGSVVSISLIKSDMDLTAERQGERDLARTQRQSALQSEADPLFFKVQRGEATKQDWLDKVQEIRERFPD